MIERVDLGPSASAFAVHGIGIAVDIVDGIPRTALGKAPSSGDDRPNGPSTVRASSVRIPPRSMLTR